MDGGWIGPYTISWHCWLRLKRFEVEVEDWKGRPLSSPNEQRYLESVTKMMISLSSLSTIAMPLLYRLSFAYYVCGQEVVVVIP